MPMMVADWGMRSKTVLLLLAIALAMLRPHLPVASADPVTSEVTLYAHTDPSATSVGGRVLSLSGNATSRSAADVREGLAFTLVPSLSAPLHILGGIGVYVWLVSQASVRGTLRVGISEVTANASVMEIRSASMTEVVVPSVPRLFIFGLGRANHTLAIGSTLRFDVQFSPLNSVPVSLLWDDPSTATRLVLKVEPFPKIELRITDTSGRSSNIFPENERGMANLIAEVSVEEPFGGTNIGIVSLTVTNSSGYSLIKDTPMNLTSGSQPPFHFDYALPVTIPTGRFNVTVSVQDVAKRTFLVMNQITVTRFYTLVLVLVDAQRKPLPGMNISFSAAGKFIDEVAANSNGTAVFRLPSSQAVGPLTLLVRKGRAVILSQTVDVRSDSVLQLEAPLYDWAFLVRLQTLDLPLSGATVDLYVNGTLLASNTTDANGAAVFTSIPLGMYEIYVASSLASKRFLNVTHSSESKATVLELPILSEMPENAFFIIAGIAIITVFGAVVVARRRVQTRRFKHVADFLGGALPASAVMMIVGPTGSGKSVLLRNILFDSLRLGRHCVYASNSEMPSKVREQLAKMGLNAERYEDEKGLRFVDAYSGGTGLLSSEKHCVSSPRDLTALGIQLTSCLEEIDGKGDVFLDSLGPIVALGDSAQAVNFVQYYGARIVKFGSNFLYVVSDAIEPDLLNRLEESSDCVLRTERHAGPGKVRGRLLVKKARGVEHPQGWVGFKITPNGRMEFITLPALNR